MLKAALWFFSRSGYSSFEREIEYKSANQSGSLAQYTTIPAVFGIVISKNMATLKELENYYSLEDVYIMYDIIKVNNYNEWISYKDLEKK